MDSKCLVGTRKQKTKEQSDSVPRARLQHPAQGQHASTHTRTETYIHRTIHATHTETHRETYICTETYIHRSIHETEKHAYTHKHTCKYVQTHTHGNTCAQKTIQAAHVHRNMQPTHAHNHAFMYAHKHCTQRNIQHMCT